LEEIAVLCYSLPQPLFSFFFSLALDTAVNIASGTGLQKREILRYDPLSFFGGLLASPDSRIRDKACRAICLTVRHNRDQVQRLFANNVVPPLLRCLADADP
jgi:hypothetical protein